MRFNAVIFDLDGVLADSQPIHFEADKLLLKGRGVSASDSDVARYAGRSLKDRLAMFAAEFNIAPEAAPCETAAAMEREHTAIITGLLDGSAIAASRGARGFLEFIRENGVKRAVASSSSQAFILRLLDKIGLTEFFPVIISGEDVKRGKPAPDVFLAAASAVNELPYKCAVIEDSAGGVTAAKAAGMFCCGYYNPTSGEQDLSPADIIIKDFRDAAGAIFNM